MTGRKMQRPRLEVSSCSEISAKLNPDCLYEVEIVSHRGPMGSFIEIKRPDITRLRKFLEKCERYLAERRSR